MVKKGKKTGKKGSLRFALECADPVRERIMDVASFEKYLKDRIKVNGKAGALGDKVTIEREDSRLNVTAQAPFSKRYLKYLTKKYLAKNQLKEFLHVVADSKAGYELRFFKISEGDAPAEGDE
mmetsp:Transcript_24253/g.53706  ORF Transcript_24253/g.53706 Transcript_24253/m.53706 type:complete len:123 (-) Transcript_24253:45-413(-)|eukprot:CAMPEP_0116921816 /NCGR_PEP_ID=MMETSP0467-20121206/21875_1 /TAXON_ID=283647 /ORGANISM="Mesodinium pulex, Strain SPMC105" /LENGTH=122 /DNA_ID=CAMNT_0004599995 /DNA_START=37 /DNA_END=405 /DNA_ORIENTATION=+